MTINAIKFGTFMSYISSRNNQVMSYYDCEEIIKMIYDMVEVSNFNSGDIDQLMMLMKEGTRKIEAIKLHRQMTGFGLKESKDAIEKYWVSKVNDPSY